MLKARKFFLGCVITLSTIAAAFLLWLSTQYTVPIIMYHHVVEGIEGEPNFVSTLNFEYQLRYLKEHGYHVLSLATLAEAIKNKKTLSSKSVVLTFDDGYEDNFTYAFELLKKYGYSATIFMPSDFIGQEGYLNVEQLKKMQQSGITIGSHTRSHAYLPDLSLEEQIKEIQGSKEILEEKLVQTIDFLAYPAGGFSEGVKEAVEHAGYKAACTTNRGEDRFNQDLLELKRVRLSDKDNRDDYLWIKLSGYYNMFRQLKQPN